MTIKVFNFFKIILVGLGGFFFLIEKRKGLFCIGLVDFACKVEMDEGSNCSNLSFCVIFNS